MLSVIAALQRMFSHLSEIFIKINHAIDHKNTQWISRRVVQLCL